MILPCFTHVVFLQRYLDIDEYDIGVDFPQTKENQELCRSSFSDNLIIFLNIKAINHIL